MHIIVFPGQGSQFTGMGKALFKKFPDKTNQASQTLGYDIVRLCVEDPDNQLNLTQFTQPALYVVNALSWLDHQTKPEPDYLLGHSLGEYNALHAAGAFDFVTGLRLVEERGRLMGMASEGSMLAVLNMPVEELKVLLENENFNKIEIANYNTATQIVLSGDKQQIEQAAKVLRQQKVMAIPLNVSAAFHSSYMKSAAEQFDEFLTRIDFQPLSVPVIANVNARPYKDKSIATNLSQQIASSVLWSESIRYLMARQKDFTYAELGEKSVLGRMIDYIQANERALSPGL